MRDLDDLLPRVLEKAPACPEPTALRHLRDAAIEFCRRTRIWRSSESFEVGDEQGCEVIVPQQYSAIYEITHARFEDIDLIPVTIDWLDKHKPGWRTADAGTPAYITQTAPNTVRVVPEPEDEGELALELILEPSHDAEQLIDVLVQQHDRALADGALSTLLVLPADFANPDIAGVHAARFADALGRGSDRIQRGQQRARRRTTPGSLF